MARVFLIEATPFDPATGAPVTVRLAGGGRRHFTHKGRVDWKGGVMAPPKVTAALGFDAGGFTGGGVPSVSAIGWMPAQAAPAAELAGLMWIGAAIAVSSGDDASEAPTWIEEIAGTIDGYQVQKGAFVFTLSDLAGALGRPLLTGTFAGTGGVEGDAEATGRTKRRSWGACFNVEGRILRKASNVWEFGDPARPLQAFDLVKDRGRGASAQVLLGWQGSVAATLAALEAAAAPAGGCVVAPSIACVKWWTTGPAPLTADLRGEIGGGYVETVAAIAERVSLAAGGPAVLGLPALTALRPDPAGLHVDDAGESAAAVLDRLLLPASLAWSIGASGVLNLAPIAFADPVERVHASLIEREAAYAPVTRFAVGYRRNHRVHNAAEISAAVLDGTVSWGDGTPLDDLRPAEAGANVTGTNVAAAIVGQAAAATDALIEGGATNDRGEDTRNDDFAPLYYRTNWFLRTRTEFKAIGAVGSPAGAGGTYGALQTYAPWGDPSGGPVTQRLTDSGGRRFVRFSNGASPEGWGAWQPEYSGNRRPFFGADLLESDGGPLALLSGFKTTLGTAAGIAGQGTFATKSYASLDDGGLFGMPTRLLPFAGDPNYLVATRIAWAGGNTLEAFKPAEAGANVTEGRTAAAITGQAYLATNYPARLFGNPIHGDYYLDATRMAYTDANGNTVQGLKPAEAGANVTGNNTAAGIAGQAAWATYTGLVPASVAGQVQKLGVDGNMPAGGVYLPGVNLLSNVWPAEAGANVTEGRTAAAITAQSYLATNYPARLFGNPIHGDYYLDAARMAYTDANGNTVQGLKPAEAGANVTGNNTAAGIAGQGTLATQSSVTYSTQVAGLPLAIQPGSFFASGYQYAWAIYQSDGNRNLDTYFPATTGADKTGNATASAIAGQGAFATISSAAYGSSYLTGFSTLATLDRVKLGSGGGMVDEYNSYWLTSGVVVTSYGTAGAIAGQGTLATKSMADTDDLAPNSATNAVAVDFSGAIAGGALGNYVTIAEFQVTTTRSTDQILLLIGASLSALVVAGFGTVNGILVYLQLVRGSTVIRQPSVYLESDTGSVSRGNISIIDMDAPGVGTFTYTLKGMVQSKGGSPTSGSISVSDGTFVPVILKR